MKYIILILTLSPFACKKEDDCEKTKVEFSVTNNVGDNMNISIRYWDNGTYKNLLSQDVPFNQTYRNEIPQNRYIINIYQSGGKAYYFDTIQMNPCEDYHWDLNQ
jgi:hypothetical protein